MIRVREIADPQGGRNRIRDGDPVRVLRGHLDLTGFDAVFRYADLDPAGEVVAVTVVGGRGYTHGRSARDQTGVVEWRTVPPDRIRRRRRSSS